MRKESAVLPHCDAAGVYANHIDMAKSLKDSSTNYRIVMQSMRSMYCLAEDSMKVLLRHSLAPNSHGRVRSLPTTPEACEEFIMSTKGSPEARDVGRLALILEDQGHYKKAEGKFRRAVGMLIVSMQCSPEARVLSQLALKLENQGDHQEAEQMFREAFQLFGETQSPGPDDVATLFCLNKMASLLLNRGQCRDAESYGRSCLKARITISGRRSTPTLLTADNLVSCLRYQGKHQDAYNLLRDALESTDLIIPDTVSHVKLLSTLAKLAFDCKENDVAESLSCDVVRKSICLYGDKHPFTLNRMSDLAAILSWTGGFSSAEAMSRRALDGLEQTLGTDHPCCLKAGRRLADYISFQRRYDDASLRLKQILKTQELRMETHHPDTLSTMRSLGAVYAFRGYLKDAEVLLDQALSGHEKCFGLDHPHTKWTPAALAHVKALQKKQSPVEEEEQRESHEILGPQSRSILENKRHRHVYTNSTFPWPIEGAVIQLAGDGDQERLKNILDEIGVDTHILGRALREAAANTQEKVVRLLLDYNAPINLQSGFHGTALQAASFAGSKAVVQLLLDGKADLNLEGGRFGNAIRAAILGRHTDIVGLLLDSGKVSQDVLNSSIQLALRTGDTNCIHQILQAGAEINARDNLFGTPLQQASFFRQEGFMTILLDNGADVQMKAGIFGSALQAAMVTKNKSAIAQLLEAGTSFESNLLGRPRSESEVTALADILLGRPADSSERIPASNCVGSQDPLQPPPRSATDWPEATASPIKADRGSKDCGIHPNKAGKMSKPKPTSLWKRFLNPRTRIEKD